VKIKKYKSKDKHDMCSCSCSDRTNWGDFNIAVFSFLADRSKNNLQSVQLLVGRELVSSPMDGCRVSVQHSSRPVKPSHLGFSSTACFENISATWRNMNGVGGRGHDPQKCGVWDIVRGV